MLTPEQLEAIPYSLVRLYRKFEDDLLMDIAKRIAKAGRITDIEEWQIIRLAELGEATDYIKRRVAQLSKLSDAEIERVFYDAAQASTEFDNKIYKRAGLSPTPLRQSDSLMQLLEAGIRQTQGELKNFARSMGFAVKNGSKTVFKPIAQVYQQALGMAQLQVASGAYDYIYAVRQATKTLADSGIRFVDYATGWVNHSDVAVRRAVLTGIGQSCGRIAEAQMDDMDCDLVEVTAHAGARPDHAIWQGKIFSRSGKSNKYPDFVTSTGYGTGAGLKGWNCRHDFYPYFEGQPKAYTHEDLANIDPPPVTYEGKKYTYYEATQKQRQIETAMRKIKRGIIAAENSGDAEQATALRAKFKSKNAYYFAFSRAAGLKTQIERTKVII